MAAASPAAIVLPLLLGLSAAHAQPATPPVPGVAGRVREIALDAGTRARADALWGRGFDAPIVLHDPASGNSWRWSGREADGFVPERLPADLPPANTCVELRGERTALLVLPLPEDGDGLAALFWHERAHCLQQALGFQAGREGGTAHLDRERGRAWLRLELRALRAAAAGDEPGAMRRHLRAALAFRAHRDALFPGALAGEVAMERNEGLAESSGRTLAHADREALRAWLLEALAAGDGFDSHVRRAAYLTGPAYGFLLDALAPGWRRALPLDGDLAAMAAREIGQGSDGDAERLAAAYAAAAVFADERRRAQARHARETRLRALLVDGPVLRLALSDPMASFDPRHLFPLEGEGTVYTPLTITDTWGRLDAEGGALLASDWSHVRVADREAEGCGRRWRGRGWKLELSEGRGLRRTADGRLELVGDAGEDCGRDGAGKLSGRAPLALPDRRG